MQGVVVPKDKFPVRRKAACCGLQAKRGESVLVIPYRKSGQLVGNIVLHRRCLFDAIRDLPLDADDYNSQFEALKEAMTAEGTAFPETEFTARRKRKRR